MTLNSKLYDALKPVALVWIPALATLWFASAGIWSLPHTTEVIGSLSAVDTFLGGVLHISSKSFSPPLPSQPNQSSDGQLVIDKSDPEKDTYSLVVTTPVSEIDRKTQIVLDVKPKA